MDSAIYQKIFGHSTLTYQLLIHAEFFALLTKLSNDLLYILHIHLLVNLAHNIVDPLHGSHHLGVDLEGAQRHRDGAELRLHLIHALDLVSDADQVLGHGLCGTVLVLRG